MKDVNIEISHSAIGLLVLALALLVGVYVAGKSMADSHARYMVEHGYVEMPDCNYRETHWELKK